MGTTTVRTLRVAAVILAMGSLPGSAQQAETPQVTFQNLRDGLKDPTRWVIYGGDYGSQRHSPLTQITPQNVQRLTPQWAFQTETLGKFEATPVVLDGVIYITGPEDIGWALDARTGRQIWRYKRDLPNGVIACCGRVTAGLPRWATGSSRRRSTPTSWR